MNRLPEGFTHWLIETKETSEVNDETPVCATPYNPKSGLLMYGLMFITSAKEATTGKKVACKGYDRELQKYIEKRMKDEHTKTT